MFNFPRHLIFPDKVYIFSVIHQSEVGRAVERDLTDYFVEIKNPLDGSDSHRLLLGMVKGLAIGYRERVPIEWVLSRFFCDYIRSGSLHLVDGKAGEVLSFKNYKKYLGQATTDEEMRKTLSYIFESWVRTFPKENLSFREIFVSAISIPEETLKRGLEAFKLKV
jgi:hypothetical protein